MLWRRLRGIVGMGLLWGIAWAPILALVVTVITLRFGLPFSFGFIRQGASTGFLWGFAAGALFGGVLMLAEQSRGFAKLTPWRGALWGVVGGLWFPISLVAATGRNPSSMIALFSVTVTVMAALGAASGWLTVRLAQAGEGAAEPALLEGGDPLAPTVAEQRPSAQDRAP